MIKPNDKKNILISGIFVSVLFAIIIGTVFMLNKENAIFSNNIIIIGQVSNAQNLKSGAAIQLRGIKVGSVQEIRIKDLNTIEILMSINSDYIRWIKKDAIVFFKTQGVLGDKFLEITGGTEEAHRISSNDHIEINESSKIDHIINKSEDLMFVAANLLSKVDRMLESVEHTRLANIINSLDKLGTNTNELVKSINKVELAKAVENLNQSTNSMNRIAKQIEHGPGSMHSLIYDQGLHEDLRSVLGGANRSKLLKFFIRESIQKNEYEKINQK